MFGLSLYVDALSPGRGKRSPERWLRDAPRGGLEDLDGTPLASRLSGWAFCRRYLSTSRSCPLLTDGTMEEDC